MWFAELDVGARRRRAAACPRGIREAVIKPGPDARLGAGSPSGPGVGAGSDHWRHGRTDTGMHAEAAQREEVFGAGQEDNHPGRHFREALVQAPAGPVGHDRWGYRSGGAGFMTR